MQKKGIKYITAIAVMGVLFALFSLPAMAADDTYIVTPNSTLGYFNYKINNGVITKIVGSNDGTSTRASIIQGGITWWSSNYTYNFALNVKANQLFTIQFAYEVNRGAVSGTTTAVKATITFINTGVHQSKVINLPIQLTSSGIQYYTENFTFPIAITAIESVVIEYTINPSSGASKYIYAHPFTINPELFDNPRPDTAGNADKAGKDMENAEKAAKGGKTDAQIKSEAKAAVDPAQFSELKGNTTTINNFVVNTLDSFGSGYKSLILLSCSLGLGCFVMGKKVGKG